MKITLNLSDFVAKRLKELVEQNIEEGIFDEQTTEEEGMKCIANIALELALDNHNGIF